jgi:eukaryotic-like serine/threonine-protein kinase
MTDGRPDERFDEETRALLQTRLMAVLGVLSVVACFYALSHVALGLLPSRERQASLLVPLLTFAIGAGLGLVALRCRTGRRSLVELRTLDALATVLTCWVLAGSLTEVSPRNEASISIVLGTTYVLMARAVFLPSSGWRTFGIGALSLVPAGLVATHLRLQAFGLLERPDEWPLQASLVFRNLAVTAFLASLASHVIYGLRQQVRESARLGQYLLREKIGEGGMGAVYRATHAMLRRDTAVKVLLPSRMGELGLMRFEREVKLTAQLKHPSTVAIFDYGRTPDGVFYYAMEYLVGGDLERLIEYAGALPPARVVFILDQLCRALAEAHALGLIHRDVKPSNVLLGERGGEGDAAKILDFGLVKNLHAEEDAARTQDGALTGTPLYLSPENIADPDTVDARSDIYSLGALAYFLLVGAPLFEGKSIVEVCAAHLHSPPPLPSARNAKATPELDAAILRCLQKQPADRFDTALALRDALVACRFAEPWGAREAAAWWVLHREPFAAFCLASRAARFGSSGQGPEAAIEVDLRGRRRAERDATP